MADFMGKLAFFEMMCCTLWCAGMGWLHARQKRFLEHRKWMIRTTGCLIGAFFGTRLAAPFIAFLPVEILWPLDMALGAPIGILVADVYLRSCQAKEQAYRRQVSLALRT